VTDRQSAHGRTLRRFLDPSLWLSFVCQLARRADAWIFGADYAQYHRILRRLVLDGGCDSLLDVGCGERSPIAFFAEDIQYRVGVDAHSPSIERSRIAGIHSDYVLANVLEIGAKFAPVSFDCITLLEVIEHLSRADGEKLLDQCERIARKKVIVSTPNGFVPQLSEPDNPLQEHLSGWTAEEFRNRGYEVTGIAGWKPFRGPLMRPRWRPHAFFGRLSLLTEAWAEKRPDRAFQILCVKQLDKI
jgi:2-polyprenyl-3-methyl-5-hydroxy-6-metoxy-1,4-benzoquinol methylase